MKQSSLKRALFGKPWALALATFNDLKAFADTEIDLSGFAISSGEPKVEDRGPVRIIHCEGIIVKRPSLLDALFGGIVSNQKIADAVEAAVADTAVNAVVLHIDSPGGEVAGTFEACEDIFAARQGGKAIVAHGDGMMASAAFAIASQCDQVFLTSGTEAGSIGIVCTYNDLNRMMLNAGVDTHTFRSNDRKPGDPFQDVHGRDLQAQVDRFQQIFVETVAKGRGLSVPEVETVADARVLIGPDAVGVMADGVASLDEVVALLS